MKFTIIMKNPDSFEDSILRAVESVMIEDNLEERLELKALKYEELKKIASKWFEYDEYVRIEIDSEAKTAKVLEV